MKTTINIMKVLKDTGRTMYVDEAVAKSAPTRTGKLEFFKPEKYMTCQELADEYEKRGLIPASILSLCEYDKTNRDDLDKKKWVCSQWKDKEGKWCYVTVFQWRGGERSVGVYRIDDEWHVSWWAAGYRSQVSPQSSDIDAVEPLSLESRLKNVEQFMRDNFKGFTI